MDLTLVDRNESISAERAPYYYWIVVAVTIIELLVIGYILLSALELLPENEASPAQEGVVLDQGDRLVWLGMEVTPLSRTIRKEFSIPRKVKGMFVLESGDLAEACGIRTGDVIRSINRRGVSGRRSFVRVANDIGYYDGVLLDLYRNGREYYAILPTPYAYGPLFGPYRREWQLGRPIWHQALPYGPLSGNVWR